MSDISDAIREILNQRLPQRTTIPWGATFALSENKEITGIVLNNLATIYIQIVHNDFDIGDGTIRLERKSQDCPYWVEIPGSTYTITTGTDQTVDWSISGNAASQYRLVYTIGTDTAGTIDTIYVEVKQ